MAVVVPAYNAAATLPRCLAALEASEHRPDEIVVVDDGSTDPTAEIARRHGARVVPSSRPQSGAAAARNVGVVQTTAGLVVFVDADVAVHADSLGRFAALFAEEAELGAAFGSYDAQPPCRTAVSLYTNLRHHYTHQTASPEAWTFWSGLGAIRRGAFDRLGGFDDAMATSVEDIELGMRLRQSGGKIRLDPAIQATHLKAWTLGSLIRTDIKLRAIPWTRLLLQSRDVPADMNLGWSARVAALLAWSIPGWAVAGCFWPWLWLGVPAALAGVVVLHRGLFGCLLRHAGLAKTLAAVALHTLHLAYSSAVFGGMLVASKFNRPEAPAGKRGDGP